MLFFVAAPTTPMTTEEEIRQRYRCPRRETGHEKVPEVARDGVDKVDD